MSSIRRIPARSRAVIAASICAVLVAACGGGATFTPSGPCTVDGRAHGAYPQLEALLPTSLTVRDATAQDLVEKPPTSVDSGRSCTPTALGSLRAHDVHELRSAGATWDEGNGKGTTIAVLALPGGDLPVAWAEEFYEAGARTAKRTEQIQTSRPTMSGIQVFRLDTLNDLSVQSVVVWKDGSIARVVIVATPVTVSTSRAQHDDRVELAVASAKAAPAAPASVGPAEGSAGPTGSPSG